MSESEIRAKLLHKRNEIFDRANRLHSEVHARTEPYNANFAEQSIELENLDVLFQLDAASRIQLSAINNTIERLDAGEYGICVACTKPIDTMRLSVLPYAETCIDCASQQSKVG